MVKNTTLLEFPCRADECGSLVAVECEETVPFPVSRVYYIYGVGKGTRRGFHSHLNLEQALVCVKGSVRILVEDDKKSENFILDSPTKALYIGPMVWREMYDFSEDAVLLVLASHHYDPADYERNHDRFLSKAKKYFFQKKDLL